LSRFGFAEPEAMLAAFFRSTEAGGDFRMNVKDLSLKTVLSIRPGNSEAEWTDEIHEFGEIK
jgi:hypothetical protein